MSKDANACPASILLSVTAYAKTVNEVIFAFA